MSKLQAWMKKANKRDGDVAKIVGVSRVQINRIRRSVVGASPATARKLEKLTGIRWWNFVEKTARKAAP